MKAARRKNSQTAPLRSVHVAAKSVAADVRDESPTNPLKQRAGREGSSCTATDLERLPAEEKRLLLTTKHERYKKMKESYKQMKLLANTTISDDPGSKPMRRKLKVARSHIIALKEDILALKATSAVAVPVVVATTAGEVCAEGLASIGSETGAYAAPPAPSVRSSPLPTPRSHSQSDFSPRETTDDAMDSAMDVQSVHLRSPSSCTMSALIEPEMPGARNKTPSYSEPIPKPVWSLGTWVEFRDDVAPRRTGDNHSGGDGARCIGKVVDMEFASNRSKVNDDGCDGNNLNEGLQNAAGALSSPFSWQYTIKRRDTQLCRCAESAITSRLGPVSASQEQAALNHIEQLLRTQSMTGLEHEQMLRRWHLRQEQRDKQQRTFTEEAEMLRVQARAQMGRYASWVLEKWQQQPDFTPDCMDRERYLQFIRECNREWVSSRAAAE